jgi:hypothetical protein
MRSDCKLSIHPESSSPPGLVWNESTLPLNFLFGYLWTEVGVSNQGAIDIHKKLLTGLATTTAAKTSVKSGVRKKRMVR